jgi:hypothetical protein
LASAAFELFKLHFEEPFDINDGEFKLPLTTTDNKENATLEFQVFKPKFGIPPLRKV